MNYADESDRATVEEERFVEESLRRALKPVPTLQAKGACYNCDEPLTDGTRFCDHHCRDDYERRSMNRRLG